jgi:hypothetical protein
MLSKVSTWLADFDKKPPSIPTHLDLIPSNFHPSIEHHEDEASFRDYSKLDSDIKRYHP